MPQVHVGVKSISSHSGVLLAAQEFIHSGYLLETNHKARH